jgi:hypothetical protein
MGRVRGGGVRRLGNAGRSINLKIPNKTKQSDSYTFKLLRQSLH